MKRLQILFIVLTAYIIIQFGWWAYMLKDLNYNLYELRSQLVKHNTETTAQVAELTSLKKQLRAKYWMIAGEGLVFFSLLIYGIIQTYHAFKKEFTLAKQQKNFLLSITHEFKSPLAAVKLNLQTIKKHALSKEQTAAMLESTLSETDRLNELVENALTAAQIDTHSFSIVSDRISLSNLVEHVINSKKISNKHFEVIDLKVQPDIYIDGDEFALTSVILNLVENAIKYSFGEKGIQVLLTQESNMAVLRVADQGIGISDSLKQKVFEKFFRIGNEETRRTKGTGLGLFIVKKIVEFHHGLIRIEDNKPSGTIFVLELPLAKS
ncbi:MAG: HAMP domain-containing histidine kinase [Bacteroidetes bacterium]|nr:HAMP domain-containing histidine kinase [Bacteroidota bacterium]